MTERSPSLAIFGGAPTFAEKLHVGCPNLGNRESFLARVNDILDRRWLTNNGTYVQEFERAIAEKLDVRHCIALCNGTVALEIAIRALGLKGEVIVPAFTFVATAHSLQWQKISPVFCDIDPLTHTLDPRRVESLITPRTTGIIGVHLWGRPCDVEALQAIADRRGLTLMFDAAHAFGCARNGKMIGNFGAAEVFSFHATKFFNTFEGGAIVTNDDELAARVRLMKNFGFAGYDNVVYVGTNGKMTEICAAMGLAGLESLDGFIEANRRNYRAYRAGLAGIPGVSLVSYDESERNNFQYVVTEIDMEAAGISRDLLLWVLHAENILARRYFFPGCHRMEPYSSLLAPEQIMLPNTERVASRVLSLPTGTAVSPEDVAAVCRIIRAAVENATAVRECAEKLVP